MKMESLHSTSINQAVRPHVVQKVTECFLCSHSLHMDLNAVGSRAIAEAGPRAITEAGRERTIDRGFTCVVDWA